jgi:hypothetical protein
MTVLGIAESESRLAIGWVVDGKVTDTASVDIGPPESVECLAKICDFVLNGVEAVCPEVVVLQESLLPAQMAYRRYWVEGIACLKLDLHRRGYQFGNYPCEVGTKLFLIETQDRLRSICVGASPREWAKFLLMINRELPLANRPHIEVDAVILAYLCGRRISLSAGSNRRTC